MTGVVVTGPIDGILDHSSLDDIPKLVCLPLMPLGIVLIALEIGIDYLSRPSVGRQKFGNLVSLARNHNKPSPIKDYDLLWSLVAEAQHYCPYGREIVTLYCLDEVIKDDFDDRHVDRTGANVFYNSPEVIYQLFGELEIQQSLDKLSSGCPEHGDDCIVYRLFGVQNPIETYRDRLSRLS
jgi:hypothetical protein